MIKSSYTWNKKGDIFSVYKFEEYKIIWFRVGDGTCQWIYNGILILIFIEDLCYIGIILQKEPNL